MAKIPIMNTANMIRLAVGAYLRQLGYISKIDGKQNIIKTELGSPY